MTAEEMLARLRRGEIDRYVGKGANGLPPVVIDRPAARPR